jgi:hypothetical protein
MLTVLLTMTDDPPATLATPAMVNHTIRAGQVMYQKP